MLKKTYELPPAVLPRLKSTRLTVKAFPLKLRLMDGLLLHGYW